MAQLGYHPNVVSIIGVVTSGLPLFLVLSFCERGSIKAALLAGEVNGQRRPKDVPSHTVVRQMAIEIARGMVHLVEHRFVHRDLASRNVLLDSQHVCKIADFGLSRGVHTSSRDAAGKEESEYYTSRNGTFPVRWTAPEAMETMKFSMSTDVWSYGVVLLEIGLGGGTPYPELATNNVVITKIMQGYKMPQPNGCSDEVYKLYTDCCSLEPSDRPSFSDIVGTLEAEDGELEADAASTSESVAAGSVAEQNTYAARGTVSNPNDVGVPCTQKMRTSSNPFGGDEPHLNLYAQTLGSQDTEGQDTYAVRGVISENVVVPAANEQRVDILETSFGENPYAQTIAEQCDPGIENVDGHAVGIPVAESGDDTYAVRGVISENVVGMSPARLHVHVPDSTPAEDDGDNLYAQTMPHQFETSFETATRLSHETQPPASGVDETSGYMDVVGGNNTDGYMAVSPSLETFSSGVEANESDNEEV